MGVSISQLLGPARVVLSVRSTRRAYAINEVAKTLDGLPEITNFAGFYAELLARERLDTTCIGNEVALPHARTDHANAIVMAAGRSVEGIRFEKGDQTVRLLFVLATPKARAQDYLLVVGALCRLLKHADVREGLLRAPTPEAFIETIAAAETRLAAGGAA